MSEFPRVVFVGVEDKMPEPNTSASDGRTWKPKLSTLSEVVVMNREVTQVTC
jgi:hypothetical protein